MADMTGIEVVPSPQMKRRKTGYFVCKDSVIYRLYTVRVTWADGRRKDFDSEEEAEKFIKE